MATLILGGFRTAVQFLVLHTSAGHSHPRKFRAARPGNKRKQTPESESRHPTSTFFDTVLVPNNLPICVEYCGRISGTSSQQLVTSMIAAAGGWTSWQMDEMGGVLAV
jgi:hypothetical protein